MSLNDPDFYIQVYAVQALGEFGLQASVAIPKLLELRKSAESYVGKPEMQEVIDGALKKIEPAASDADIQ